MAFDIREIFARALGGRRIHENLFIADTATSDEDTDDDPPGSPIGAALNSAAAPDADDMTLGGATTSTAFLPEGVNALPSAACDMTSAADDEAVASEQAELVAEIAVAAALADGELTGEQYRDLLESLHEVPGLESLEGDDIRAITQRLECMAPNHKNDPEEFIAAFEDRLDDLAVTLRDPALRRAAYQLAVYFCAWNGILADSELDLLAAIAEAFEISDLEARGLREATLIEAGLEQDDKFTMS